jgi:hypothetical protein
MKKALFRVTALSLVLLANGGFALVACGGNDPIPPSTPVQLAPLSSANANVAQDMQPAPPPPAPVVNVPRADWNRIANELFMPIYWVEDKDKDGELDPSEVALVWGVDPSAKLDDYVSPQGAQAPRGSSGWGPKMSDAQAKIRARYKDGIDAKGLSQDEIKRRTAVAKELAQGRASVVLTDLTGASDEDKKLVRHVMNAAVTIERLYAKQEGTTELAAKIPADDTQGKSLFFRAQGPKCDAPLTKGDTMCSAVPGGVSGKISGLYPQEMLKDDKFCEKLTASKDKKLMDPFTVVRMGPPKTVTSKDTKATGMSDPAPTAVPYTTEYKDDMELVAKELEAAAGDITSPSEAALKAYLLADAKSFRTNDWVPADEAWAKMSATNSRWYLRIAPDETYKEPCSTKALFHVSFGKINQASLKYQQKLDPMKNDMEKAIADLAGPPYKANKVTFKLPDFMDVVLNAGDSRMERGATIGQSLPNFGPVANQHRGRTVAMTNFYTDADSLDTGETRAKALLCSETMALYTRDPEPLLFSTVLHEATHNLGPSAQYKVGGKIDREVFQGGLASMLEELKAQSGALYFIDWLSEKNEYDKTEAHKSHVGDLLWAFGHIADGMYDSDGHPEVYNQLSAIQLAVLMREGAVKWEEKPAANGSDKGCFNMDFAKMPAGVKTMLTIVAQIKGKGDKAGAEELKKQYVDVPADDKLRKTITERVLRQPKPSFYYSIKMD